MCQLVLTVFDWTDVEKQGVDGETGRKSKLLKIIFMQDQWQMKNWNWERTTERKKILNNQNWMKPS